MASVKIIQRTNKINKEGNAPLYLQLIHNGKSKEITLKTYLPPKAWDKNHQRVRKGYDNASLINVYLRKEKAKVDELVNHKLANELEFTVHSIFQELRSGTNSNQLTLTAYLTDFVEKNPEGLAYNTIRGYKYTLSLLNELSPTLLVSEINHDWILSFEKYMTEKGLKINTVSDRMKILRKLTGNLIRESLIESNPFQNYRRKKEESIREFLVRDELKRLEQVQCNSHIEELVKDSFLFSCYTGLRFSDICVLSKANVKTSSLTDGSRRSILSLKMQKTTQVLQMPLSKKAEAIIDSWQAKQDHFVFSILKPSLAKADSTSMKISISSQNAYFNRLLKDLISRAEIDKSISFHCARHTFATLSLDLGIPIEVVSKLLGHKNLKETQIYAKILDRQKELAMDKWDNF